MFVIGQVKYLKNHENATVALECSSMPSLHESLLLIRVFLFCFSLSADQDSEFVSKSCLFSGLTH